MVGCVIFAARTNLFKLALVTLLAAITLPLHAQDSSPQQHPSQFQFPTPPGIQIQPQPEAIQQMPEDPYWQETVERAVERFQSDNPEVRRSAVMLLGKYPVEPAQRVVDQALEDPHAGVRQAALVSVLEEQGQVTPLRAEKLLRLLADPDVSIRRIASNSVRTFVFSFPFGIQPGSAQMQRQISPAATRILQDAFLDDDVSVRRNMVTNYSFLQITVPEETVVSLLHDPDIEVAVHALRWGLSRLSPATLTAEVPEFVRHENEAFRLELARALQAHRSPAVLSALETLQDDPHPPVAIEAMLASFNQRPSAELYERMTKLFWEGGRRSDAGQRIIFAAQILGDEARPFLREWMTINDPALRQHAVQIYLNRFGRLADPEFLLSLLNDSVQGIRQQAMRTLMQIYEQLSEDDIRKTMSNRYPDVRQSAAGLASLLPPSRAEDLLLDLLLDDVREVRQAALQQIGLRQISGWKEIMSISLRVEDDPVIQRVALDWLMRNSDSEILDLLRSFLEENPQSPLRPQVEAHLQRNRRTAGPS